MDPGGGQVEGQSRTSHPKWVKEASGRPHLTQLPHQATLGTILCKTKSELLIRQGKSARNEVGMVTAHARKLQPFFEESGEVSPCDLRPANPP